MNPLKLVIIDRDGTINFDSAEFIKCADEWQAMPGALEAVARLNHAGWHVVLATNQSGLGRGLFEVSALNDIHTKMHQQLSALGGRIDAVFYCPHTADDGCRCRKPAAGLLEQIAERYGISLKGVPMVGDALRDMQAGAAAGCALHLVLTGKAADYRGHSLPDTFPDHTQVHADLASFAEFLLTRTALQA